jgi:alkanesulfonate monooxygenase SsuD/methylene tetrahydromethanopterin reductase-like flavin-dependent oxidoreductase (luciferase family)
MQIGLCLPQLGGNVDRDGLRAFCERAEELGYGSLWVQEHIFYPLNPVSGYSARPGLKVPDAYRSTLAALGTLTAAAAWTSGPVVGSSILVAGLHRPVALAQQLSTIDTLSGGRLVAGFSVGWSDEEHQVMDVDPRTRGARCDELIDALVACWGPDPVQFSGRFFTLHTLSVDELCDEVARSRAAGVDAVIIDTNFDPALDTPERWAEVPRTLAPLLEAAR